MAKRLAKCEKSGETGEGLTKKPKQKIPINATFWFFFRFSLLRAGKGTTKTITSVTMLPAALIYQKGRLGMQVPGVSGSQNFSMGVQVKMTTSSWEMDHKATMIPASITTFLICGVPRMRQYWRRKVILIAVNDPL